MLLELFCLITHLLGDTSELLLILNLLIPCIILTLIEFSVQLFQLFVFFLFLRIEIFLLLCNLSCLLILFFFVFFRLFFKCLIIFLFGLFEVFSIFLFNFFDLLQKFVFIFQNFSDVFAKEWGVALSECLYFRHWVSEHLLFKLACFIISTCAVVYEAKLIPFWRELKFCFEVLGILRDQNVFCGLSSIFSVSYAFWIVGKFGED